jgi:hypothetical protein
MPEPTLSESQINDFIVNNVENRHYANLIKLLIKQCFEYYKDKKE